MQQQPYAPAYNPYAPPQQQPYQQPYPQPFAQPLPVVDPMVAQMKAMTEQIERENQKLLGQLSGNGGDSNANSAVGGGGNQMPFVDFLQHPESQFGNKQQPLYMLERDKTDMFGNKINSNKPVQLNFKQPDTSNINSNVSRVPETYPAMSKDDRKYQNEIKNIQYEIEKLKYSSELEEMRSEFDRQRIARAKEMEHTNWLESQRQELQAIKMKQVIAKEQRLLKMQQDGEGDGETKKNSGVAASGGVAGVLSTVRYQSLKEECGVGNIPLPVDLCRGTHLSPIDCVHSSYLIHNAFLLHIYATLHFIISISLPVADFSRVTFILGISVLVDGLLLAPKHQSGGYYRVALGVYDKAGKSVVRLIATEWQPWSNAPNAANTAVSVQYLDSIVMRTIKQPSTTTPGSNAVTRQTRENEGAPQKTMAWAVLALTNSSGSLDSNMSTFAAAPTSVTSRNNNSSSSVNVANNAWRGILRTGISDPLCDPIAALSFSDNYLENSFVLLRIVDSADSVRATGWSLQDVEDLKNLTALQFFYKDPLNIGSDDSPKTAAAVAQSVKTSLEPPARPPSSQQAAVEASRKITTPSTKMAPSMQSMRPASSSRPMTNSIKPLEKVPEEPAADRASVKVRSADDKLYWYLGTPNGPAVDRYQRGDGIDIYIDSAMFLPDTVTVSKLTLRLYTASKEQIGTTYEIYSHATSPATSPIYKHKVEVRSGNMLNTTLTALIRIDTFEYSTLFPVGVGYVCFKVFSTRDRTQPKTSNEPNPYINSGLFQLPVLAGRIPPTIPEYNDAMLSGLAKIPCASLLVRIQPAPKSADGISTLSKDEYPAEEWARLGLDVTAPSYVSGAYNGALCEPTPSELICYNSKSTNVAETVEAALTQAISAKETTDLPKKPTPTNNTAVDAKVTAAWLASLFPAQVRRTLDLSLAVPYHVESGLHVVVDSLYSMPEGSVFNSSSNILYKVVASLTPPGLFYKEPPLSDGIYYTKQNDLERSYRAPGFLDGAFEFTPTEMSDNLFLLLDIRTIKVEPPSKASSKAFTTTEPVITVEPAVPRKSYWSVLAVGRERVSGQGAHYSQSGVFQLPLFEGPVPYKEIFKSSSGSSNAHTELKTRLQSKNKTTGIKVLEGASILVKIYNPALSALVLPTINTPDLLINSAFMNDLLDLAETGLSGAAARSDKFTYDAQRYNVSEKNNQKTTAQTLPKVADEKELLKTINKAFEAKASITSSS